MSLSETNQNIIRGKTLVGHQTREDVLSLLDYIWDLERLLDQAENYETFGTEGWRHYLGIDE